MGFIEKLYNFLRGGNQSPQLPVKNNTDLLVQAQLNEDVESAVEGIKQGKIYMLPYLYGVFAEPLHKKVPEALEVCTEVYCGLNQQQLMKLEGDFMQTTSITWCANWRTVQLEPILNLCRSEDEKAAFLGFGSFNPNGFYRQKCVKELENLPNHALPFVFMRLNDWVPSVLETAQQVATKTLESCTDEHLFYALPCLLKAQKGSRSQSFVEQNVMPYLVKRLQQSITKSNLQNVLQGANVYMRRLCYKVAMDAGLIPREDMLEQLYFEQDNIIKINTVKAMLSLEENAGDIALLERLINDKSSHVRLLAAEKMYAHCGANADWLEQCLLDSSSRMRNYAQYICRKHSVFSLPDFYRSCLNLHGAPAILGLCETSTAEEAQHIMPFLHSPRSKLVKAVLNGLVRLDVKGIDHVFYDFLSDERDGVAKAAFRCLKNVNYRLSGEDIGIALTSATSVTRKKRLVQLICSLSYWDYKYYMLLCVKEEDLRQMVVERLEIFRVNFTKPSAVQKERCGAALMEAREYLPQKLYRELEFEFTQTW